MSRDCRSSSLNHCGGRHRLICAMPIRWWNDWTDLGCQFLRLNDQLRCAGSIAICKRPTMDVLNCGAWCEAPPSMWDTRMWRPDRTPPSAIGDRQNRWSFRWTCIENCYHRRVDMLQPIRNNLSRGQQNRTLEWKKKNYVWVISWWRWAMVVGAATRTEQIISKIELTCVFTRCLTICIERWFLW